MTPRPKANSERTNVFFSPEVMEQLRALAEKKGTSVSGLIRMIVLEFFYLNNDLVIFWNQAAEPGVPFRRAFRAPPPYERGNTDDYLCGWDTSGRAAGLEK